MTQTGPDNDSGHGGNENPAPPTVEHAELSDGTPYEIRPFEDGDREEVRRLYGLTRPDEPGAGWLDWKFRDPPCADEVTMFVASGPDGILGIRPFIPLRMRAGDTTFDGVCFVNALVHPEYRGQGIFGALTDRALAYQAARRDIVFCFTNENSTPIYEHWGWERVRDAVTQFRFNDPAAVAADGHRSGWLAKAVSAGSGLVLDACDRRVTPPAEVTVSHVTDVPVDRLAALYRENVPEQIHVVRDEPYYRWRLGDPEQNWDGYVASRNGTDLGAVVTRTWRPSAEYTRTDVEDAVYATDDSHDVQSALLDRVLADNEETAVVATPEMAFARQLLGKRGFLATDWPLVSDIYRRAFTQLTLFVKPVGDLALDVTDPDAWSISSLMRDTN